MLNRIKGALVESFVGAIAVGWIFAEAVLHLAYTVSAPITGWITRREYATTAQQTATPNGLLLRDAVPNFIRFVSLLLVAYILLRWLYMPPKLTSSPEHG